MEYCIVTQSRSLFWISLTVLRLFSYCHFLIRARQWFRFSRRTLSVTRLALFLVAFTGTTLFVLLCAVARTVSRSIQLSFDFEQINTRVADRILADILAISELRRGLGSADASIKCRCAHSGMTGPGGQFSNSRGLSCKRFLTLLPRPSPLFYSRHFSRGHGLSLLVLCSETARKRVLRRLIILPKRALCYKTWNCW